MWVPKPKGCNHVMIDHDLLFVTLKLKPPTDLGQSQETDSKSSEDFHGFSPNLHGCNRMVSLLFIQFQVFRFVFHLILPGLCY